MYFRKSEITLKKQQLTITQKNNYDKKISAEDTLWILFHLLLTWVYIILFDFYAT